MSERGESGWSPNEAEPQQYFHRELHAAVPDERDDGVRQWYEHREHLASYSPDELAAVRTELHELPEVMEHAHERVSLHNIAGLPGLAYEHVSETNRTSFASVELVYAGLMADLEKQIGQYADTVIRFQRTKIAAMLKEPEEYQALVRTVDTARRRSHDALISQVNAISRYLTMSLPKVAGPGFKSAAWEQDLRRRWFTIDELRDRERIGTWAIQEDIVSKAEAIEAAINAVLEHKDADAG